MRQEIHVSGILLGILETDCFNKLYSLMKKAAPV